MCIRLPARPCNRRGLCILTPLACRSDPDGDITGWGENDRGVGFTFGPNVVMEFLEREGLELICRAHQVIMALQ